MQKKTLPKNYFNNSISTKITVFITVALKKALPKISGMPYFISISAYSYLSSVFIVGIKIQPRNFDFV